MTSFLPHGKCKEDLRYHGFVVCIAAALVLADCTSGSQAPVGSVLSAPRHLSAGVPSAVPSHANIQHIVIIMLENRSFDNYFGTFPGANGLPLPGTCNPDPASGKCIYSYHDTSLVNYGGPHRLADTITDLDGGKLDGFIVSAESAPKYSDPTPDEVMGYHTCAEIPVYCTYAQDYTLADNHFAPSNSWSIVTHLYLVSGWSATCSTRGDPMSCTSAPDLLGNGNQDYAWTDITWLLHAHGISWGYYVYPKGLAMQDDQGDGEGPNSLGVTTWDPLPAFDDVKLDNQTGNIQPGSNFVAQAASGTLPAVSWVVPTFKRSDHPPTPINLGQTWVKQQIDAVKNGPDWPSTIILVTWDEWGGFYDHVVPPVIDGLGYGFRTPLLVIGPMVKRGHIDHQLLSSDAYLKLIEDTFMGSARLDANDGRRDSRPDVREEAPGLGDLRNDFN